MSESTPELVPDFAVSQFTTWNQTFEEDIELFVRQGIATIELCERKLAEDTGKASEQLALLKEAGLRVSSIQPRVHALFPDSMNPANDHVERRAQHLRDTIVLMADHFPGTPLVTITGNAPRYNYREAWNIALRNYRRLAEITEDHGMTLAFEPLNPILMNNDTFISSLDGALELIEAVNSASFGLTLDVWHVWHEADIHRRISRLGSELQVVHVCDWPADRPRAPGDRVLPGDGCIDLRGLLGAIEASGYRGAYSLEVFSEGWLPDSIWKEPGERVLKRAFAGFMQAWQERHHYAPGGQP